MEVRLQGKKEYQTSKEITNEHDKCEGSKNGDTRMRRLRKNKTKSESCGENSNACAKFQELK